MPDRESKKFKICRKALLNSNRNPATTSKLAEFWAQLACVHAKTDYKIKRRAFADAGVTVPVHGPVVRVQHHA